MKKIFRTGNLIIVLFVIAIVFITAKDFHMDEAVELSVGFLLAAFVVLFEKKETDARTMAAVATISAIGGVMRVPFAAIPGIQPVTFLCAVAGYTLGPVNGFMTGALCAFISNFFLGQGPWTLWQMMGWGLCGCFFGAFRKPMEKLGIKGFIVMCGLWGYIYGTILNQWYTLEFLGGLSLKTVIAGNVLSFSYDSMHAFGNLVFATVFGKNFIEILERYNRRNKVVRIRSFKAKEGERKVIGKAGVSVRGQEVPVDVRYYSNIIKEEGQKCLRR